MMDAMWMDGTVWNGRMEEIETTCAILTNGIVAPLATQIDR